MFTLEEAPNLTSKKDKEGFWHQFFSVYNFKTVKNNKELFWVFTIMMVYFIGFNIYFPYVTIYFVNFLGLDYGITGLIQGISLLIAVILTIPASKYINGGKNAKVISIALIVNVIGLIIISTKPVVLFLGVGMLLTGAGYVIILQTITAWFKNLYPEEQRGQFEGVKQIFFVCIPMIIGPNISSFIIHTWGVQGIVNEKAGMIPNEMLFVISTVITLLTFLPLIPAGKHLKNRKLS